MAWANYSPCVVRQILPPRQGALTGRSTRRDLAPKLLAAVVVLRRGFHERCGFNVGAEHLHDLIEWSELQQVRGDLPRLGGQLGVLDGRGNLERVGIDAAIALDDMQRV